MFSGRVSEWVGRGIGPRAGVHHGGFLLLTRLRLATSNVAFSRSIVALVLERPADRLSRQARSVVGHARPPFSLIAFSLAAAPPVNQFSPAERTRIPKP